MRKFSKLFEASGNVYQKGTPFSNGHRSRREKDGFLEDRHYMIDIDSIVVDKSDKIVAIIENKKQTPGEKSKFKNILDPKVSTAQKIALLELSRLLGCKLYVNIESEKKYHLLRPDFTTKEYTQELIVNTMLEKNLRLINTDNLIFIEFRRNYNRVLFKAIFERPGSQNILYSYINQMAMACGKIPYLQVDDSGKDMTFRSNGKLIGVVPSVLQPQYVDDITRTNLENKWSEIWKKIGIWD